MNERETMEAIWNTMYTGCPREIRISHRNAFFNEATVNFLFA